MSKKIKLFIYLLFLFSAIQLLLFAFIIFIIATNNSKESLGFFATLSVDGLWEVLLISLVLGTLGIFLVFKTRSKAKKQQIINKKLIAISILMILTNGVDATFMTRDLNIPNTINDYVFNLKLKSLENGAINCGEIHNGFGENNPNTAPDKVATCFFSNYTGCKPSYFTYSEGGIDTSQSDTYVIYPGNKSCLLTDFGSNGSIARVYENIYQCSQLTFDQGLLNFTCDDNRSSSIDTNPNSQNSTSQ